MGIEAVTARLQTTAARLAGRLGQHDHRAGPARQDRVGLWQAGGRDAGDVGQRPGSSAGSGRSTRPASPTLNTGPGSGTTSMTGVRR